MQMANQEYGVLPLHLTSTCLRDERDVVLLMPVPPVSSPQWYGSAYPRSPFTPLQPTITAIAHEGSRLIEAASIYTSPPANRNAATSRDTRCHSSSPYISHTTVRPSPARKGLSKRTREAITQAGTTLKQDKELMNVTADVVTAQERWRGAAQDRPYCPPRPWHRHSWHRSAPDDQAYFEHHPC